MNRRNFFKTVTGIIAGLAFWPKAKVSTAKWIKRNSEWRHIVICGSGANDDFELYLNGKRID